jgi:predicted nuclease of predicted toxin-antitoxin system
MRFLVDNALSPAVAVLLTDAGHNAVRVRTLNLPHAQDIAVFEHAAGDDRVVVSVDTDFGTLLAFRADPAQPMIVVATAGRSTI